MSEVVLNYVGAVDMGDWGRRELQLSDLLTPQDMANAIMLGVDHRFELAVELATENTGGALVARVRLRKI